jgi:hypothetical protein
LGGHFAAGNRGPGILFRGCLLGHLAGLTRRRGRVLPGRRWASVSRRVHPGAGDRQPRLYECRHRRGLHNLPVRRPVALSTARAERTRRAKVHCGWRGLTAVRAPRRPGSAWHTGLGASLRLVWMMAPTCSG